MKKALVIIATIAILGTIAAYVDPLGGGGHKTLASIAKSPSTATSTPTPATSFNTPAASTNSASSSPSTSSSSPSSATTSGAYKNGTFHGGDISSPYGDVQVSVAISGGKITDVTFDQLNPQDRHSQAIESNATPQLKSQTLSAQSANIDGVSGASYTSQAYVQSLQSALDQAKA